MNKTLFFKIFFFLQKENIFCLFSQWVKLLFLVYVNIVRVYSPVYHLTDIVRQILVFLKSSLEICLL